MTAARPPAAAPPPGDPAVLGAPGDPESVARAICLRQLDRRARTRAELAETLRRRGVPDEPANAVLNRFAEVGLIDDAALAETVAAAQHRDRGLSARAVAATLRRRGVAEVDVQAAVEPIDRDSEYRAAAALVARKLRSLSGQPPPVQARRLVGLLGRRGYPAGLAYDVVRAALSAAGSELGPPPE